MDYTLFEKIRVEKGVSQQHVAVKMGLSLTTYRNKEKGRSKFFADEIPSYCEAVGVNARKFINLIFFDQ